MEKKADGIRTGLVNAAVEFLGNRSGDELQDFRARVNELAGKISAEELSRVVSRIQSTGAEWGYHAPEPFARSIHWAMADVALAPDSTLEGMGELCAVRDGRPLVFLPNHLSYADANLFEILLHRSGFQDIADKLTVVAGPKVYEELFRRFSSLCFGTIKTPQSTSRSSGEAVMSPREVAKIAQQTIAVAQDRQAKGEHLLVFLEGSRSRSGTMQRGLPAVARYFELSRSLLVPVGITGTERLFPVGDERVHPTTVRVRVGSPVPSEKLAEAARGNRRLMVDAMGLRIAELLPPPYRGAYADGAEEIEEARRVVAAL